MGEKGIYRIDYFHDRPFTCTHAVIDPCDSSPCANNGSCVPGMGPPRSRVDYTCQCVAGYTGSRCEVNIDDCQSAIYPNNSMCVDGVNSYVCTCLPGFETSNDRHSCVMVLQTENHTGPKSG